MNQDKAVFSEAIRDLRIQLNISQEDLARAIGVSFATVNRWENGKSLPSKLAASQLLSFCKRKMQQSDLPTSISTWLKNRFKGTE